MPRTSAGVAVSCPGITSPGLGGGAWRAGGGAPAGVGGGGGARDRAQAVRDAGHAGEVVAQGAA
ncbi:hypothetical protein ACFVZ2_42440, partial [Streptomyces lasiicapitis]